MSRNGKLQLKIRTVQMRITPAKARKLLEKNLHNRPKRDKYIMQLAGAMQAGEWELNGETIKLNVNGEVEDGQHRLEACIAANTAFETFVTTGLPCGAFDNIGTGKARSVGDVFARKGEANYCVLAGAISWLWRYNQGLWGASLTGGFPRHAQSLQTLEEHPAIRESISAVGKTGGLMSQSAAVCLHYLFSQKDPHLATSFFRGVFTGENLSKTSGMYHFRDRLIKNRMDKSNLPAREIIPLAIKAWNAERANQSVRSLRFRTDGERREVFPQIQ